MNRNKVLAFRSVKKSHEFTWFAELSENTSLVSVKVVNMSFFFLIYEIINGTEAIALVQKWLCQFFRRCGYTMRSARQALELWHGIMKEIGGKFGSSVLTYFMFLKWLLLFNIFSFVVNFSFITVPLLVYDPNITSSVSFRGLELLTGAVSGAKLRLQVFTLNFGLFRGDKEKSQGINQVLTVNMLL